MFLGMPLQAKCSVLQLRKKMYRKLGKKRRSEKKAAEK
jgi:hypothetical protein